MGMGEEEDSAGRNSWTGLVYDLDDVTYVTT